MAVRFLQYFYLFLFSFLSVVAQATDPVTIGGPGSPGDGGTAHQALLRAPAGLAVDAQGNVYVADMKDHRIRRFTPGGNITTVAGTGVAGLGAVGKNATETKLQSPISVVIDGQGRVVFSDRGNCRILRLEMDGTLQLIAGTGTCGFGPDGVAATTSRISPVASIAYDSAGNLLMSETFNSRIRQVTPAGVVTTIAGTGAYGISGDNGPATSARLSDPGPLTIGQNGDIYFADGLYTVRAVSKGIIRTVAGTGSCCASGDGGLAIQAKLSSITALLADSSGNLIIGSLTMFRRVTPDGRIGVLWGNGELGSSGDGGSPVIATFNMPAALIQDARGDFYIADSGNHRIRRISNSVIQSIAGGRVSLGDGGPAIQATFFDVDSSAVGPDGSYYFVDSGDARVRKISPTGVMTTVAGNGQPGMPSGTTFANADKIDPLSVAVSPQGVVYIGAFDGIYRIDPNNFLRRVAGIPEILGQTGDGGSALAASVFFVGGLAVDAAGNIYAAETLQNCIRKITPSGIITTIAGVRDWDGGFRGDGGPAMAALLNLPRGLAVDPAGNLYVADDYNDRVRKIDPTGRITTVAGSGAYTFSGDGGPALQAGLMAPRAVTIDAAGNLFIADRFNYRIRRVTPEGTISTVAVPQVTDPTSGSELFYTPTAVAAHPGGVIVGDSGTSRIVQLRPRAGTACTYAASPTALTSVPAAGTSGSLSITTQPGCAWTATTTTAWVSLTAPASGSGSGTLAYTIAANTGIARSGAINIGSVIVNVSQLAAGGTGPGTSAPTIVTGGVVNNASYATEIAASSYVTIYGSNFAAAGTIANWDNVIPAGSTTLPTVLAGLRVKIADKDCYVYYVNADLGMAVVLTPPDLPAGTATVTVTTTLGSASSSVSVVPRSPAFFSYGLNGKLYPSATFANELIYVAAVGALPGVTSRPAAAGDRLTLYLNAVGSTATPIPAGQAFAPGVYFPIADPASLSMTIGGINAPIEFAGMTIAGVWQLNIVVPPGVPSGDQPVVLNSGTQRTQTGAVLTFQ